ncbi:FG-GAP repeat domain-containing protein [Singulisphaera rosea]
MASCAVGLVLLVALAGGAWRYSTGGLRATPAAVPPPAPKPTHPYQPRKPLESSGFSLILTMVDRWKPDASLQDVAECWRDVGHRLGRVVDERLAQPSMTDEAKVPLLVRKAMLLNSEAEPENAYAALAEARGLAERNKSVRDAWLYSLVYFQGISALRLGEDQNCILCRGESSCILPISSAAAHTNPHGSRLAIERFTEYLERFPDDLEVRWLLNLAHMTLGEYPQKVDPRYRISYDRYLKSEFDIGRFRDIGDRAKVNRFNQAGGAVMEDFDDDGRLDLAVTSFDPTQRMEVYRNRGDGTFEERTEAAGVTDQLGGLYCVQADYNNDGAVDLFIPRGAWLPLPIRPTLLKNVGGRFVDVTREAGLLHPVNSNSASWADYDNDGWVDLFVCCENQSNRLYHNEGNGTFTEVASRAGLFALNQTFCKGAAWIDYDNDRYPDLFLNDLKGSGQLFHNKRDGTFRDASVPMGIDGPRVGFSCWAWDFDNDGWLDIFAASYDRTLAGVVQGLMGQPHNLNANKLYRNRGGKGFEDVTRKTGLDMVFATMGSNFGDFDNDGFLDMYLGTGEPHLSTLVPNRMFKNVEGRRFAEITASSGTGHLQKGHAVACGDWDRDGDIDLFLEMGGATNGDRYHNVLFENPGQGNHWLTVKLVGKQTNRSAIGARIKAVTAGKASATIYRHVSSGSSFGANPLQQTLGLARATKISSLEIYWPTSDTTQVFRDVDADQAIEVTEFAKEYRRLDWSPIPLPK